MEKTPEVTHTISERFTEPVFCSTPVGDTKIPEPIMLPTMTVIPFSKLIFALRQISSSPEEMAFCPVPSFSDTAEYFCFSGILSAQNDTQSLTLTAVTHGSTETTCPTCFSSANKLQQQNSPPFNTRRSSSLALRRAQCNTSLDFQQMSVRTLMYTPTHYFLTPIRICAGLNISNY